ncbi:MAG: arginine deiminase [Bacteroidales bacterium]|nr:arginine deiminase [Candidatus Colimorpha onthohippi]
MDSDNQINVNVASECGRLQAVLLHKPGIEIERMTPESAPEALYSDILNKHIVDQEYGNFCGVFERWCKVYYVQDLLLELVRRDEVREWLVVESCAIDSCEFLKEELLRLPNDRLAAALIEGYEYQPGKHPSRYASERYILKPLYNLFFTRDASSSVYEWVLINSLSFQCRRRETLIYKAIFEHYFGCGTLCASLRDKDAHTEGGDVQIARPNVLCIGEGIRTNRKGIEYLADIFAQERKEPFYIVAQQLPHKPDSFIHLDMVFTHLSQHECMIYEPMLRKTGIFADKQTAIYTIASGKVKVETKSNILEALESVGISMKPVFCGGSDPWVQQREQWHSGANFFALDEGKIIGYERNTHTIEALSKAGFAVLPAEDICSGKIVMDNYAKFVAVFKGSDLPRAGGGARCMTMPINRLELRK